MQTFSLAPHELVTNGVGYGALRNGRGAPSVIWTVNSGENNGRHLVLNWIESGVDLARGGSRPTMSRAGA